MDKVSVTIIWQKLARQKIQALIDYYTTEANERIAEKVAGRIVGKARLLIHSPQVGQREPILEGQPPEFRRLLEGRYKIIYYVEGETIYIADVWDTRRNPVALRESLLREMN
jgi:plasmid stabilization system protein ParE